MKLFFFKKEELDLLREYIDNKNDILKKLLEDNLIKTTIRDLNLMSDLNNIFKIEKLNDFNDNLLMLQNNYIFKQLKKLEESLNKNEVLLGDTNILKLKEDLSNIMKIKKKNLSKRIISNNNFLNKYYDRLYEDSSKFKILIIFNIKNILKIYKKEAMSGGNLVNDTDGSLISYMLNNLIKQILNKEKVYMTSNMYNEIINNFIIKNNSNIELKNISLTSDNYSKAKKYWYLSYINEVLKDLYDYKTNSRTIIEDFDSINTLNKIKKYLDEMKEKHKNKVFSINRNLNSFILTEHIRDTDINNYMSLISNVNNILLNEIMKLWQDKEINKPIGTISPEIIRMISDNVNNSVDSYYKSDLDEISNIFESSINELNNINSFISTTHRPELLEVIDSQGYLSGGYKLINMDL